MDRTASRDYLEQAMEAHRTGRRAEADTLYRQAVQANPGDARALRLRGILARELGDLEASARFLRRAAEVAPADAAPLAELALTAMAADDLDAAVRALRGALRRDPGHLRALANLGALLQYRGHISEAIALHQRALEGNPADAGVRANLAKALMEAGRGEEALRATDAGLDRSPADPQLLAARGAVLCDLERFEQAAQVLEGAIARYPDDDMALVNLAYAHARLGAADRALESLRRALAANAANGRAAADLVQLLGAAGRFDDALAMAEDYLARQPGERHVLAAAGYVLRDAGHGSAADQLLDFARLVRVVDLAPPAGFASIEALNAALLAVLGADASLLADPVSKATRGGSQTGELDFASDVALGAFGKLIAAEVRVMSRELTGAGLGAHPAMAPATPRWTARAWGTVLRPGGHQLPHIHPHGWLSGVYYVSLPEGMDAAGDQAGWLEFGTPPERFRVAAAPTTWAVQPRPGRLVMFPSYFYHRTLPFSVAGDRVSIAFDIVPR